VAEFASFVRQNYSRFDILVNNAGVNPSKQPEEDSILTAKTDTVREHPTLEDIPELAEY
jgi:NADP-dependent 3-hydroxy acid dehydrogenase YdfG